MAQAKSVAPVTLSPMVMALIAGSNAKPRETLGTRLLNGTIDGATSVTVAAGQMTQAFDAQHFNDGVKIQKLRTIETRAQRWSNVQKQYGLSDADIAALVDA